MAQRRDIIGYEDQYEVDEDGSIYSLDREVLGKDGTIYPFKGKKLKTHPHKDVAYLIVNLWKNNKGCNYYVHRIIAKAFIPNPLNKSEINHIDGNRQNNAISNLEWCTSSENKQHAWDTGLRTVTCKMSQKALMDCLSDVLNGESYLAISMRVPYQVPFLSVKVRRLAREHGIEHLLNDALKLQKNERMRNVNS